MLSIVIERGIARRHDLADGFTALQQIVGGYIEPFFTIPSPEGNGDLTGYVNEEGLMMQLPMDFGVVHSPDYIVPLAGDAVITGLTDEGETRGLTETEVMRIMSAFRRPKMGVCPVVEGQFTGMLVPVEHVLVLPALQS